MRKLEWLLAADDAEDGLREIGLGRDRKSKHSKRNSDREKSHLSPFLLLLAIRPQEAPHMESMKGKSSRGSIGVPASAALPVSLHLLHYGAATWYEALSASATSNVPRNGTEQHSVSTLE